MILQPPFTEAVAADLPRRHTIASNPRRFNFIFPLRYYNQILPIDPKNSAPPSEFWPTALDIPNHLSTLEIIGPDL
jgi:hypothetical protein